MHTMAHCDEITCLDLHAPSGLCVTGHKGSGDIHVCVWEPTNGTIIQRLNCGPVNGASAIAFSPDGKMIAVAVQNENHSIFLFDWKQGYLKASVDGGRQKVLCVAFSVFPPLPLGEDAPPPSDPGISYARGKLSLFPPNNSMVADTDIPVRIIQGGISHFNILELKSETGPSNGAGGRSLLSRTGSFGDAKASNVLCCAALPAGEESEGGDEYVMGMSDGTLGVLVRGEQTVTRFVSVQKGSVTSICVVLLKKEGVVQSEEEEGQMFKVVTGGTLGFIKVFDQTFEELQSFNLYKLPELYGSLHPLGKVRGIKSVCVDRYNRKILYGTAGGEIGEIAFVDGVDMNTGTGGALVKAHFRDQLHALAASPTRQEALTAGDDKTLRIWNIERSIQETYIDLPDVARSACYSPNGHLIAVGLGGIVRGLNRPVPRPCNGQVVIISYLQGVLNIVHKTTDSSEAITSVAFSPDGGHLYSTSLDGSIYVHNALDNFKLIKRLNGHTESISSLDIIMDGKYLISYGVISEVILWHTNKYEMVDEDEKFKLLGIAYRDPTAWNLR